MAKKFSRAGFTIIIALSILLQFSLCKNVIAASNGTKIKKIEVSPCINNIQQDSDNSSVYRVAVNNSVTSVNINVEPNDSRSSVNIDGNNGLEVGTNRVDVTITGEDGNSDSYIIYVRRLSKEIADTPITPNVQEEKQEFVKPESSEIQPADNIGEENLIDAMEITNEIDQNSVLEDENIVVEKLENETAKWENNVFNDNTKRRILIIGICIVIVVIVITIIIIKRRRYKTRH